MRRWIFSLLLVACSRAPSSPPVQSTSTSSPSESAPVVDAASQALSTPEAKPASEPAPSTALDRTAKTAGSRSALGINIGANNYYAQQIMFLDLTKQAADWGLHSHGVPPKQDAQGWPTGLTRQHGAGFVANAGKGGRYVILYDGKGKIEVGNGQQISHHAGRYEVRLKGGETHFTITESDPQNPIRSIRIVPLEYEKNYAEQIFHPQFLALVEPFSVLRFMDYFATNGSSQQRWRDRVTPDYFSQGTDKGGAIEYAIALCNRVHADCWFNIPHMADDDYVRHYAELVRDQLDPDLRAYVEYSNEVWNFEHGDWIQKAGEKAGMKREWDTRLRYQARRSVQIFKIFERALGKQRLVRVLAGQCFPLRLQILLEQDKAYRHADALAIAPYFGYELTEDANIDKLKGASAQELAEGARAKLNDLRDRLRELKQLADKYKLPLIAYEGGQHLATGGQYHADKALQALLDEVNRSPQMGDAYRKYLELWRDEGGQLMVLYKLVEGYSQWGRWGLLEDMWQPLAKAPKYKASLAFIEEQPRWWREPGRAGRE